ncbi:MAG: S1 RNA-binding domain-containing protein [Dehalococcoidia bacterium]|nr:S1 RNA-binding domain-containing protein [Dehalococcoidia bacterium]
MVHGDRPQQDGVNTSSSPSMEQLLREFGGWKEVRRGELVSGVIMGIAPDSLLVNVGSKSEGVIPQHEMKTLTTEERSKLQVGASVLAIVLEPEGRHGPAVFSYDRARGEQGWQILQQALEQGIVLQGTLTGTNKGGAIVLVEGVAGFVPLSQLSPDTRMGVQGKEGELISSRPVAVKVLELDKSRHRVVLSERAAWQEQREEKKKKALTELREGQTVTGKIRSLSTFGAFVDIGGVEGLLHVTELSWNNIRVPEDIVKVGDELPVMITKIDKETGRISLSLKQLQAHPWDAVASKYQIGQLVHGIVTKLAPFGAFVRLEPGVEGLIHVSELSTKPIQTPQQAVKEGDQIEAKVVRIDTERHRLGLSRKQALEELGDSGAEDGREAIA